MANDRIIFGSSTVFLFRHQDQVAKASKPDTPEAPITEEFALEERAQSLVVPVVAAPATTQSTDIVAQPMSI